MLCVGNSSVVKIYIIRPKPGPVAKNATPRPSGWESNPRPNPRVRTRVQARVRLGIEPASRGRGFDSQPEGLGVAFFATGPGLGLIMYIFTTLEFPTHNIDFHLLTTSVNAKYYY